MAILHPPFSGFHGRVRRPAMRDLGAKDLGERDLGIFLALHKVGEAMNVEDFRGRVVRATLKKMALHSDSAENLLVGTALQESRLHYLKQLGGPALGLYQMEPETHDDIWVNYLADREDLFNKVWEFTSNQPTENIVLRTVTDEGAPLKIPFNYPDAEELIWNLAYATAMARVHYLRVPWRLPAPDDIEGLSLYWKQHWNTPQGKGEPKDFVRKYRASHEV